MSDALLALEGVTLRSPEGHLVFEGLDWRLQRGQRFHLKGVRGGGASAFLRLCCGIADPEAGRMVLDGAPLTSSYAPHPFLERGALGYVPSDGGLAVNMPLLGNVALPLRFALNLGRDEAEAEARRWLAKAGLLEAAHLRPRVPADTQAWLTSLARAVAKRPALLLVDRPPGGLEEPQRLAARDLLTEGGQDPAVAMILVGGAWLADLGRPMTIIESRVTE